ncbi:MAG: zinc metallopeptidase [Spirochaetes bacterium]|nr:zinc metallopeptidase [Spirochaetota bacterium]
MFMIDPLYIMIIAPVFLFSLWATIRVKTTFNKYSKVGSNSGLTGSEVARLILRQNGLGNVDVVETEGFLSDHYDPRHHIVRLSPEVYHSNSIAAIGVAAHETGHALQHAKEYAPLMLRNTMVPIASIGSNLSWIIIFAGLLLQMANLLVFGIILFTSVVAFQVITLPVEFNASRRAKEVLASYGILNSREIEGVNKVLSAAAMTYVAAAASALATLLYYILRLFMMRDE